MRNCRALLVVFGAMLFNTAHGANFEGKRLFSHSHRDVVAQVAGDVKQGENGETPDRTIPCQAAAIKRVAEGVTTRGRAISGNASTSALPSYAGDEIVCSAWEHAGAPDKELGTTGYIYSRNNWTTIQNRSGTLADNVTNNNALLMKLKQRGNVKPFSGGNVIMQEIMYNDTSTENAGSYSGYDLIDITPNSPISAAQFDIKQYAAAVSMSGLEMLQNSGKEQIIDMLEGRVQVAEAQLENDISTGLYSNGTGNGGKDITGLALAVSTSPGSGSYGGIDRGTWSFWQNIAFDATTDGGAAATAANIQSYMNRVAVQLVRGADRPDMIVAGNNYYRAYLESLQAIQRVTSESSAGAGFTSLKYFGAGFNCDVFLDGGIGGQLNTNRMYFLNTKYIFFRPHRDRNFVPIGGDRQSVNQDAIVKLIGWAGNLTCSGARYQGVLSD